MSDERPTRPALLCAWCEQPVDLPQPGWHGAPAPAYCSQHHLIAGRDPNVILPAALLEAQEDLHREVDTLPRWPWPSLHEAAGVITPGSVTYVAAFPGNGKTSFVAHLVQHWITTQNLKVLHMPLEATPKEWMTRLICLDLGIAPDEALSYRLLEQAKAGDVRARMARQALLDQYALVQEEPRQYGNMIVEPSDMLSVAKFQQSLEAGAAAGVQLVVVDHVDHVGHDDADQRNEFTKSTAIQHAAKRFARETDIPVVLMTQLNSKATGGDTLHKYKPPRMEWLWFKGVKEQIGYTFLGLFRPLDPTLDEAQLRAARDGQSGQMGEPNTIGVSIMKTRYGGERLDRVVKLHYAYGLITERTQGEHLAGESLTHRITTRPPGHPAPWRAG